MNHALRDEIESLLHRLHGAAEYRREFGMAESADIFDAAGSTITRLVAECERQDTEITRLRDASWFDDPDYQEHAEVLFADCPDEWDSDIGQEAIIENYVVHLVEEVKRLGGCLKPWCPNEEGEPCDHGYLDGAVLSSEPSTRPRSET